MSTVNKFINKAGLAHLIKKIKEELTGVVTGYVVNEEDNSLSFLYREYVPTSEVDYVSSIPTEFGSISRKGVLEDSVEHARSINYAYVYGKTSVKITTGVGTTIRVLCYNENKEFLDTLWNDGTYNYVHIEDGGVFEIPSEAYYIKVRFSSTTTPLVSLAFNE